MSDQQYMQHALRLAAHGLGQVAPNPSVGAVIVKNGNIIGRGNTARGGRPHAETIALAQAGELAEGATMYVTLEPCSHYGKTPPCAEAIIKAGIKKVVVACSDSNPLVAGKGLAMLRDASIEVIENVCYEEARKLNEGFFSTIEKNRPFIALKLATSLDGKIATATGESKWITEEESRTKAHQLRAKYDAILTGIGTVLADNPKLDCRIKGLEQNSPMRIVLDSQGRTPPDAAINPAKIITESKNLSEILEQLAKAGITRLMVEAGRGVATSFLEQNLVDRIYWFRAPLIIGEDGINAASVGIVPLAQLSRYKLVDLQKLGADILEVYEV